MGKSEALLALMQSDLSEENKKAIAIKLKLASAEYFDKAATDADTASKYANLKVTNLLKVAWSKFTAFAMANPWLVAIGATIAGLTALYAVVDHFTLSLEEAKEKLATTESELESVNQQIEELNTQIKTLESLETPSITDKEDLERLKAENEELKIRQRYLEKQKQNDEKDVSNAAKQEYNRRYDSTSREDIDNRKDALSNPISSGGTASSYLTGGTTTSSTPYAAGQQAQTSEEYDKLADLIAQYELYSEKKKEAIANDNAESLEKYNQKLETVETELMNCRTELQGFADDIGLAGNSEDLENVKGDLALIDETLFSAGERLVDYVNNTLNATDTEKLTELVQNGELTADVLKKNFSEVDEYLKKNGLTLEDLISILDLYQEELENIPDKTGILSFTEQISQVESLSKGLDQLSDIYKDVKDAGDFDWSSILNKQEFIDAFGNCGDAYDEFIETITNSPDDIEACQDAFDNLATEYIYNSGVLDDLTEETKDATVAMLEQMGVTNALEVVEGKLAAQQQFLVKTGKELTDATYEEIESFIQEQNISEETRAAIVNFAMAKYNANNLTLATDGDIANLSRLVKACGEASSALDILQRLKAGDEKINIGGKEGYEYILKQAQAELDALTKVSYNTNVKYGGSGNSGSSGSSSSAKESAKIFDWIETKLSRLQRTIKNFGKTVSATWLTWSTRNDALLSEIAAVNEELVTQQKAYETYMAMANSNSVGLSDEYKQLVQSGDLRIDSITNETLKEQIELYTQYYEAALDCSDAVQDLTNSLAELAKQKFDNISAEFDNIMSTATSQMDLINAYIDLAEAKGHLVSTNYYETLKELEQQNKESLQSEYNALRQAMEDALASGAIKEGSQKHKEMKEAIADVKKEILEADIALQEYGNTIRELEWEVFDKMQEAMSQVTEETGFLMELMGNDKMHDENGNLTDEGQAVMGLHAMNYNAYMEQASAYGDELQKIEEELANDPGNQDLIERKRELIELQREAILASQDELNAMLELKKQGFDIMLDSLESAIEKYKELKDSQKDLYDYQKKIQEQVEKISTLEKQLMAWRGDDSEEAKSKIQQIQMELEDARQELEETEMDKNIEERNKLLTTIMDEAQQWVSEQMEEEAELLQAIIDEANENADLIKETLEEQAEEVGLSLSDALSSIWTTDGGMKDVVSMYGDALSGQMTTVATILQAIRDSIAAMVAGSDETAQDDIEDVIPSQPDTPIPTEPTEPIIPTEPTEPSEPSQEWGHWFVPQRYQGNKGNLDKEKSIIDRLRYNDINADMSYRKKYYEAMGLGSASSYKGTSKQNIAMVKEMRKHGFAKGGTIGSLIKSTGEDGFVLARTGEEILSLDKIKELGFTFEKMKPIVDTMKMLPNVQSNISNRNMDINVNVGDIQMYGVNDPKQFATQLKDAINSDASVRKIVNDVTLGNALGRNTLTRYTR